MLSSTNDSSSTSVEQYDQINTSSLNNDLGYGSALIESAVGGTDINQPIQPVENDVQKDVTCDVVHQIIDVKSPVLNTECKHFK